MQKPKESVPLRDHNKLTCGLHTHVRGALLRPTIVERYCSYWRLTWCWCSHCWCQWLPGTLFLNCLCGWRWCGCVGMKPASITSSYRWFYTRNLRSCSAPLLPWPPIWSVLYTRHMTVIGIFKLSRAGLLPKVRIHFDAWTYYTMHGIDNKYNLDG